MTMFSGSIGKVLLIAEDNKTGEKHKESLLNFENTEVDIVNTEKEAIIRLSPGHSYSAVVIDGQIFSVPQAMSIITSRVPKS